MLMRQMFSETNIQFFRNRHIAFAFSCVFTIAVVLCLLMHGLNLGLDFTGGSIIEFEAKTNIEEIRNIFRNADLEEAVIQKIDGRNAFVVRVDAQSLKPSAIGELLMQKIDAKIIQSDYIGPKVNDKLISSGLAALFWAMLGMMMYISLRFSLPYAICGIIALLHDLIAVLGFYTLTGYIFDLTSIAAILTVLGYSINDSVVIFDRIRENRFKLKDVALFNLINQSLNETLSRTVMTVFTTIIACCAIFFFGGVTLKGFSGAVIFGILFGAYSSVFISAPLLYYVNLEKI